MKNIFVLLLSILSSYSLMAQKEKDSVSTEVINVVTSYKPTISDAFKANESPVIPVQKKERNNLEYTIKSQPIESVFKPYSGGYKSAITKRKKSEFPDYIKAGFGNYTTPLIEAFIHKKKKGHEGSMFLYNKMSAGGINDIVLDDSYMNTKLALNYKNTKRKQAWEVTTSYQRDMYNWYGIPNTYANDVIDSIDENQVFNHVVLEGTIQLNQEWFVQSEGRLENFSDKNGSNESKFYFSPTFEFDVYDRKLNTKITLDVLHGRFQQDYDNLGEIKYSYLNLGAGASYPIQKENLFLSLGAKLMFSNDLENNKSNIYVYPDILAEFVITEELLNAYAGFTGGLIQNSYRSTTLLNPYVSPTLKIVPTSNTFKLYAGLKGKLTTSISYDVNVSYAKDKDKLLFRSNQNLTDGTNLVQNGYQAGNSFYTLYDNVATFGVFGQLSARFTDNINTGVSLTVNSYSMDSEAEPWNLPPFIASAFGTYSYGNWNTKAELFTKGKRKDLLLTSDPTDVGTIVELDAYLDLNLSADYSFNRRWSAFLELNNILNSNYEVYSNFQVQGFQILAGAVYRFDL